jgi:outer membrane protein assembly factor BamB
MDMKLNYDSKLILLAVALLGLLSSGSSRQIPTPGLAPITWPMFQRNASHTGQSPYVGITKRPMLQWVTQLPGISGGIGMGMIQDNNGTVYVNALAKLHAINPENGNILWTFAGNSVSNSVPAISDRGLIYWGFEDSFAEISMAGDLSRLWTNFSGNLLWSSSPVIAEDGSIYVTHDALFAFKPDGSPNWYYPFSFFTQSSPAIGSDGTIYVCSGLGILYAFTPDGAIKWQRGSATDVGSPAIGKDGTIYIGGAYAKLYAYHPNGDTKWVFTSDESIVDTADIMGPPAIGDDGTIYFGTVGINTSDGIYAVNPDGSRKWKFTTYPRLDGYPYNSIPIVIDRDNNIYTCSLNGACFGLDPDGALLWEYDFEDWYIHTTPYIFADGRMLILDITGKLYSLTAATEVQYLPLINLERNPIISR